MSQGNVETAYRAVDAINARDLDRLRDECDPEIELHSRSTAVSGTVYLGHAGLELWHQDLIDAWEHLPLELERVIEVDDHTSVELLTLSGKARGSDVEVRQQIAHVTSYRDAKLLRLVTYADRAEALKAVRLTE